MTGEASTAVELLRRLISFDTVSAQSNLGLIGFVRGYLAGYGIVARVLPDPSGTRANLFATIGPDAPGGVALSGHTDVVPVVGQNWSSEPFRAVVKDGKLYGRGACDMKGFIAVALSLVPEFRAKQLKRPIHLCLSFDEEIGCLGVPSLLALLGRELPLPALAIVGEPTSMRVVNAHKGVQALRTTITGRGGHSSAPERGANAIVCMARFISRLEALAAELKAEGLRAAPPGIDFDPPYTTIGIGRIDGGTAINIIPRTCTLDWEFRPLPGVDPVALRARVEDWVATELLPGLRAAAPEGNIETKLLAAVPALAPQPGGEAEALALRLTGANRAETVSFGAEAGLFQQAGISVVLCGPGSIQQAHQPDEFVELSQLAACEIFLRRLADWASA
jgi:acetylornithine deacetylase